MTELPTLRQENRFLCALGDTAAWNVILIVYHFSICFLKLALFLFSLPYYSRIILSYILLYLPVGASISITIFCLTVILKPPFFFSPYISHAIVSVLFQIQWRLKSRSESRLALHEFSELRIYSSLIHHKINGIAYTHTEQSPVCFPGVSKKGFSNTLM